MKHLIEISRVSIKKICNHLYLTEETAALSFFGDSIPLEVKHQMVIILKTQCDIICGKTTAN